MKQRWSAIVRCQLFLWIWLTGIAFPATPGIQLFIDKQYDRARTVLQQELQGGQASAETLYYLGLTFIQLGDNEKGRDHLLQALKKDPQLTRAYLDLGIAHYNLKELDRAEEALIQARQFFPENATVHLFLGLLHSAQSKYKEALQDFETAEKLNPQYRQLAQFNIGLVYYKKVNYEEARKFLELAVKLDPDNPVAEAAGKLLQTLTGQKEQKRWGVAVSGGWLYDDNVTLNSINLNSGISDKVFHAEFSSFFKPWKSEESEVVLGYDFSQTLYDQLTQFNLQMHTASTAASISLGEFNLGMTYLFNSIFLDEFKFEHIHTVAPTLGFQLTSWWYLNLGHTFSQKEFFNIPGRDGQNYMFNVANYFFLPDNTGLLWLSYDFEAEDTRANLLDYLGQNAGIGARIPLKFISDGTAVNVSYRYFFRDFQVVTPAIGKERIDQRHHMNFELSQTFLKYITINFNYQYINSDSNLRFNDFEQNIIGTSMKIAY